MGVTSSLRNLKVKLVIQAMCELRKKPTLSEVAVVLLSADGRQKLFLRNFDLSG